MIRFATPRIVGVMRGRKPKPSRIREITGNPGKRPINRREATPDPKLAKLPPQIPGDDLDRIARAEYKRIGSKLVKLGLMAEIDRPLLWMYAHAFARVQLANEDLAKNGLLVTGRMGEPVRSPALAIINQGVEQMRKLLLELGVGPSARSRIDAKPPTKQSAFKAFVNRGGSKA